MTDAERLAQIQRHFDDHRVARPNEAIEEVYGWWGHCAFLLRLLHDARAEIAERTANQAGLQRAWDEEREKVARLEAEVARLTAPPRREYEAPRDLAHKIKVRGVGRVADEPRAFLVILTERPTDDELRSFHEHARNWGLTAPPGAVAMETVERLLKIEHPIVRRNKARRGDQWEVVEGGDHDDPISDDSQILLGVYPTLDAATDAALTIWKTAKAIIIEQAEAAARAQALEDVIEHLCRNPGAYRTIVVVGMIRALAAKPQEDGSHV